MKPTDIIPEANKYRLEPAVLWALILTESSGGGFLPSPDHRLKILFERHILWKRLLERGISPSLLNRARPDLCGPRWEKKYYKGGAAEHVRLAQVYQWALKNDSTRAESYRKASLESASWGLFQIMGFNYRAAGYENVDKMVEDYQRGENVQVESALKWIKNVGLLDNLQNKDFYGFTRGYNGPGQVLIYSARMKYHYERSKKLFK